MIGKELVSEPHINIFYDVVDDILYADWKGNQNGESVQDGCEKILFHLKQQQCSKVLNDNTNVTSIWLDASEWVALDWFPRMHQAGCKLFAWVFSPNLYSQLSAEKTLEYGIKGVIATNFQSVQTARTWLQVLN